MLIQPVVADTAVPDSPLEAWEVPPAEGSLAGDPRGAAALSQTEFVAQTKVTVDQVYTVGEGGMDSGDGLRIEDPLLHGMRWSKYGATVLDSRRCTPLTDDYRGASNGLVTATTTGAAELGLERNTGDTQLHAYAYSDVWVEDGYLEQGDEIRVRYGDDSTIEDCGHQVPDRAFTAVPWRIFEHVEGSFVQLDPTPQFDVLAEDVVALLWVVAPSMAVTGEPLRLKIAVLDRLGNPVPASGLTATVEEAYGGTALELDEDNPGWVDLELVLEEPGVHRIAVSAGEHERTSNPIVVLEEEPEYRLYWGDLHTHHGHTRVLEDGTRVDENHAYARDVLALDVGCESMKLLEVEIDGEALWADLQRACEADTVEGEYLAMLGFEWMGQTHGQGHHNVYFDDCLGLLAHHADVHGLEGEGGVLERLAEAEAEQGTRGVVISHASPYTGFNWRAHDDEHRTVAEIWSGWGDSLEADDLGAVERALALDHRMGFTASSDNHDGWLGNPLTRLGHPAGMSAFWAPALERAEVFDALQERRTYATTGDRIIVDLHALVGDERIRAGTLLIPDEIQLAWEVHGTDTIEKITVRGGAPGPQANIQTLHEEEPGALDAEGSWDHPRWGSRGWAFWLRVEQADGQLAWSSPLWITKICEKEDALDPTGFCATQEQYLEREWQCGCRNAVPTTPRWWWALLLTPLLRRRTPRVAPTAPASAG